MESTLHRQLKALHGAVVGGREEVVFAGFRIDAIGPTGDLIEIQNSPLAALRPKLRELLPVARIRVVKPVVVGRHIIWRNTKGVEVSSRKSPWKGSHLDAFEELVRLTAIFPHENLQIDLLEILVDEVRIKRRRWPGHQVVDRRLQEIVERRTIATPVDLWSLLPNDPDLASGNTFTTRELAHILGKSEEFARKVAYVLRKAGAVRELGKVGNRRVYIRDDEQVPLETPARREGVSL